MTSIYLYDDARARGFEPFSLTRPLAEMRAGAWLQRERWQAALRMPVAGFVSGGHLTDFEEPGSAPAARGGLPAGTVIANARFVPRLSGLLSPTSRESGASESSVDIWLSARGGLPVAVRLSRELPAEYFADGGLSIDEVARSSAEATMLDGWWLEDVWDFVRLLPEQLGDDLAVLERSTNAEGSKRWVSPPAHATVIGAHPVLVAAAGASANGLALPAATIEPYVVLDATAGPICIEAGSTVHAFTRLTGPCYVGRHSSILGDRIGTSSIGDVCKVRGEMSNTIVLGHANKGHDGFVGHSYLGRWVNLGAGTITSNLKNTYGSVSLWTPAGTRDTGMQFLGTLFGDHAKTGIGTCLTTGTVLGTGANVYGAAMPPKVVPPFSWGSAPPYSVYRLDKFLDVAERVMERRHVTLSVTARRQLSAAHAARWTAERSE